MAEPKNEPGEKMRVLLAGGKTSTLARLPQKGGAGSFLPLDAETSTGSKDASATTEAPPSAPEPVSSHSKGIILHFGPPFWTIASVLSLTVNIILIIVLLVVFLNARSLNLGGVMDIGNGLLGGLYTNFEKMDRAHITTTIPVETTIPVKFDLQLNQQTNVVLSQDVVINNALVTVKTGGLNITNALTTIVLPQGTNLPVVLSLTVPVDTTVPVVLTVDVDIPLEQTQLHEPFSGLQEVIKPFYCMLNPTALKLSGQPVCQ
jgi:hypothetical protein